MDYIPTGGTRESQMSKLQNYTLWFLFTTFWILWLYVMIVPISQEPQLIHVKDGCSTYRFYDKGTRNYYTNCEE